LLYLLPVFAYCILLARCCLMDILLSLFAGFCLLDFACWILLAESYLLDFS